MSDSVEQTIEYQEQILDDLDDIKGSLDEESESYDKEYQKKVLGSLRNIEKSLETNNVETIYISPSTSCSTKWKKLNPSSYNSTLKTIGFSDVSYTPQYYVFDISGLDDFYISTSYNHTSIVLCSDTPVSSFTGSSSVNANYFFNGTYNNDPLHIVNVNSNFLYIHDSYEVNVSNPRMSVYYYVKSDDPIDEPEEPVEVVTTSSAVIIEGLDNLTQITTFQSFCSSLLIGIMLFLVFVKGLRK